MSLRSWGKAKAVAIHPWFLPLTFNNVWHLSFFLLFSFLLSTLYSLLSRAERARQSHLFSLALLFNCLLSTLSDEGRAGSVKFLQNACIFVSFPLFLVLMPLFPVSRLQFLAPFFPSSPIFFSVFSAPRWQIFFVFSFLCLVFGQSGLDCGLFLTIPPLLCISTHG